MNDSTLTKKIELGDRFTRCLMRLIRFIEAKQNGKIDVDIERLKGLIIFDKNENPLNPISRCTNKIWDNRDRILERDEQHFLNVKFDRYIKRDQNQRFIETIIQKLREGHATLTEAEKDDLWKIGSEMLSLVTEYKILIADYVQAQ